jgi:hypothetical protein
MTDQFNIRQTDRLLMILDNEIEKKCMEIKENRKNALFKQIFFGGCIAVAILFGLIALTGFQWMMTFVYLALFQGGALLLLVPVLFNMNGGYKDVQRIG